MNIVVILLKFMLTAGIAVTSFFLGLGIMMYGWGLKPQSWSWIILGALASFVLTVIALVINALPTED